MPTRILLQLLTALLFILACLAVGVVLRGRPSSSQLRNAVSFSPSNGGSYSREALPITGRRAISAKNRNPNTGTNHPDHGAVKLANSLRKLLGVIPAGGDLHSHLRGLYSEIPIDKASLREVASLLSDTDIDRLLTLGLNYSVEDIRRIQDREQFISNLCAIITEEGAVIEPAAEKELGLRFTHSLREDKPESSVAMSKYDASTKKIYSVFKTTQEMSSGVVFRCYNVLTGDIVTFMKHNLDMSLAYNHIWLVKPDDWDAGNYRVSIYLPDSLRELQVGYFSIAVKEGVNTL